MTLVGEVGFRPRLGFGDDATIRGAVDRERRVELRKQFRCGFSRREVREPAQPAEFAFFCPGTRSRLEHAQACALLLGSTAIALLVVRRVPLATDAGPGDVEQRARP